MEIIGRTDFMFFGCTGVKNGKRQEKRQAKPLHHACLRGLSQKKASTARLASEKSVNPKRPQLPALRAEVTERAQQKRQLFLLLVLVAPKNPASAPLARLKPS